MAFTMLRSEERIGLILAIAAHAGLLALLVLHPVTPPTIPPPERMSVTLSDHAGLTSTSPEPQAQAAPDIAPVLMPEALPSPHLAPLPRPLPGASPAPAPRPVARSAGASRIGSEFLKGVPGARASGAAHNPPAAAIGPAVQSALSGAI